jgi:hypothetical protein
MSEPRFSIHDFNTIPGHDPASNGTNPDRDSWLPLNLNDLPEQPPVHPTLGQLGNIGLLYPGKRHVFSGPQESAKTLCAYSSSSKSPAKTAQDGTYAATPARSWKPVTVTVTTETRTVLKLEQPADQ